jgi:hypothetical protein
MACNRKRTCEARELIKERRPAYQNLRKGEPKSRAKTGPLS